MGFWNPHLLIGILLMIYDIGTLTDNEACSKNEDHRIAVIITFTTMVNTRQPWYFEYLIFI